VNVVGAHDNSDSGRHSQGISLDQFRAELAGTLVGLTPSQRLKAGREMADWLAVILAAIERGEIDASATEYARLQGAAVALAILAG
jgi:hypothetical protein